ncbi:hypothetical protein GCM10023091_40300 [Ravibacter arvi]|uniref:Uncharacterized protein n=1 Tax=Ravibacter arvi TaxID=2051041 RepID=A0ABP8MBP2_9BACT
MSDLQDEIRKQLEVEGAVPEYLKTSLVSEIDLIKDTLQVVSHFGGFFFLSAFSALTAALDQNSNDEENP